MTDGVIDRNEPFLEPTSIIFDYNVTDNSIIINNPIQNNSSFEGENITFNSNILINGLLNVEGSGNINNFIPVVLPTDEGFNLNIPVINSMGTMQATDILCSDNGNINFYTCSGQTFLYNTINLNGSINLSSLSQITHLQEAFNAKLDITDFNTTNTSNLDLINTKVNILDASASLLTKLNIIDFNTTNTSNLNLINTKVNILDASASLLTKLNITDFNTTNTSNLALIDLKAPINNPTFTGTIAGITKAMISLSNVDNTSDANKPISTATQTALNLKAPIDNPIFTGTVAGITKSMVGLGNVDNTSDVNKPISTATQTAINAKLDVFHVAGRIYGNGGVNFNVGQNIVSSGNIDATATGIYVFTIPTHPRGANYIVMVTPSASSGTLCMAVSTVISSTSFTVYVYNSSGALTNSAFNYCTIP